jgi:hypothetical protein
VDSIELFPASEDFAYQDSEGKGMLLLLNAGIFYEFVKSDEFYSDKPRRYTVGEVELGINYVLIISTNAGLWGYNGDTVQFTSLKPYRIIVSGRIKHIYPLWRTRDRRKECALKEAMEEQILNEYRCPQISPVSGLPYHEWFIEFENEPEDDATFKR